MAIFELKPPEGLLDKWADKYWRENSKEEVAAFDAGKLILEADPSIENLVKIVHWKSPRAVPLIHKNEEKTVKDALQAAINNAEEPREAIKALVKLRGVGIPVASAILTAIFPDRYTVIDFRALEALGHPPNKIDFFDVYRAFCAELSDGLARRGVLHIDENRPGATPLRELDRALWQWSESKGNLDPEENPTA